MKNKNQTLIIARQGDVLIEGIATIPVTAKAQKPSRAIILAHGEVTGHHHSLIDEHVDLFETADEAGVTYLEVREAMAALTHQEHSTIVLDPGVYRVTRQREYVAPDIARNVAD